MKTLYAALIGVVLVLMVAPLAAADAAFPSWDKQINSRERFKVVGDFARAAVLDKETGLVWEQSPETAPNPTTTRTWGRAQYDCNSSTVGGRKGWRLPTIQELASLVDTSESSPALPDGHPFTLTSEQVDEYFWSATTNSSNSNYAWVLRFSDGLVGDFSAKGVNHHVWCVRGGQGVDPQ